MASNTTNATFGDEHGYNVQVRGATASWQYNLSHGAAYMANPLRPSDEICLTFSGSGHAEVGLSYKDPSTKPDKVMDCKAIVNVRLRRRETKEVVRYGQLDNIKTVSVQHFNGNVDECPIETKGPIWLMVNLKFGEVEVKIGSSRGKVKFHPTKEENIKFNNFEQTSISTIDFNPGALCFIEERIRYQEGVVFTVLPIKDSSTHSLPSNYFLKISYSTNYPAMYNKETHYITLDDTSTKDTSAEENLYHITTLERLYCNEVQIHVGLTERGLVHVRKAESDEDICVFPQKIEDTSGIYIVLEPFRTKIVLSKIEDCRHQCSKSTIDPPIIPRAASYIKIVKRLDQIEHSIENFEEENSVVSKLIDGLEHDVGEYQFTCDYLTPTSENQRIYQRKPDIGDDNTTSDEEMTMKKIYDKICRIEKRMDEETKRNSSLQLNFDEYTKKIREVVQKMEDSETLPGDQTRGSMVTTPTDIRDRIQKNAPNFIQALDLFPLCDFLLSGGVINMDKYSEFLEKSKQSRCDANREFMMLLLSGVDQQSHIWECIKNAFKQTKQEHLI